MTADFSGRLLRLPPEIQRLPTFVDEVPKPCWVSSASSIRLLEWAETCGVNSSSDVIIAGHTVWTAIDRSPTSVLVSHPNRLGASEDLAKLTELASRGFTIWVEVDPYLLGSIDLPKGLRHLVHWDAGPTLLRVGERCRQAAEALRRRIAQIPRTKFVVDRQSGRAVSFITPLPVETVVDHLRAAGAVVDSLPLLEGVVIVSTGWWHTRRQIDQLAAAIEKLMKGEDATSIDEDNYVLVPEDLPKRRLDSI